MVYSVDRVIGDRAILLGDDGEPLDMPLSSLPEGIKTGDILRWEDGKAARSPADEEARRKLVAQMLGQLLQNGDDE